MADASPPPSSTQSRVISGPSAIGICIASTVGSGIFTVTGFIGPELGTTTNLMIGWVIGGLVAICGGLAVAELAAMRPHASAQYVVVHEALGPAFGYLKGMITLLIGYVSALAAVAMVAGEYVEHLLPAIEPRWTATALLIALGIVHGTTVIGGQRFNDFLVAFKVLLVLAFIVAGFTLMGDPLLPSPELIAAARDFSPGSTIATIPDGGSPAEIEAHLRNAGGPAAFSGAMGLAVVSISFAYLGWSTAAEVAGEIRNPGRNLPFAILGSVGLVGILYILVNIVYSSVIPPAAMVEIGPEGGIEPMADIGSVVADHLLGSMGGALVTGALVFLFISTLSTGMMTGGRVIAAMCWKGELPEVGGRLNPKGAPTNAIALMTAPITAIVWFSGLGSLFEYVGLLTTVAMMVAMTSIIVMRFKAPDLPRPFRMPFYPVPPLVSIGIGLWLVISAAIEDWIPAAATAGTIVAILVLRPLLTRAVSDDGSTGPGSGSNPDTTSDVA